jgi:predicted nucleic acid-binding protein
LEAGGRNDGIEPGSGIEFLATGLASASVAGTNPSSRSQPTADGQDDGSIALAHQAIVEFVASVSRPLGDGRPLLEPMDARREAEELLSEFDVFFPDEEVVRIALRRAAAHQLSWPDARMWAFVERFGLDELISEDFQHDRLYGTVRVRNPFLP